MAAVVLTARHRPITDLVGISLFNSTWSFASARSNSMIILSTSQKGTRTSTIAVASSSHSKHEQESRPHCSDNNDKYKITPQIDLVYDSSHSMRGLFVFNLIQQSVRAKYAVMCLCCPFLPRSKFIKQSPYANCCTKWRVVLVFFFFCERLWEMILLGDTLSCNRR